MKFILTVNPHGGTKKGPQILKKVKPIFEASGAELFIIETTFAGHAKELANQLDLTEYDGFIGIGPDRDNPNFIYPYRELDLKKPAKDAIEWAYDHYIHVVESGETLWTIAKKEYGDELAWVVLFWDNEELLNSQDGKLIPGLKLKVRSELWPEVE